jgi:uncharacterized protein YodC (DUF2158 family)
MKKKESSSKFEPGDVVSLKSGGDLAFTVEKCSGSTVHVCYASGKKTVREKFPQIMLVSAETTQNDLELAVRIAFILNNVAKAGGSGDSDLDRKIGKILQLSNAKA